ncbi:glycerol-3-phosphate acyltransferase [Deinococcus sp.]|uniref:glycerol-3-phosphate acyltransferase n=1 Tax=Deinococcus sp. TaxID=47478 RepID=UPI003C7A7755
MVPALVLLLSYLLGSLVFGVLYSRLRGRDIRATDLPGGSGTFRQYGLWPAIIVTALDIGKGILAAVATQHYAPSFTWLAVAGVTLGHCYPLYFRFSGGGGIAPFNGAFMGAAPLTATPTFIVTLLIIPLYKATLQKRLKLNAIPFAAACMLIIGVIFSLLLQRGLAEFLAGGAVMAARAIHMLLQPDRAEAGGLEKTAT